MKDETWGKVILTNGTEYYGWIIKGSNGYHLETPSGEFKYFDKSEIFRVDKA